VDMIDASMALAAAHQSPTSEGSRTSGAGRLERNIRLLE
jgi:hypothetical protein